MSHKNKIKYLILSFVVIWIAFVSIVLALESKPQEKVSYNEFIEKVESKEIDEIILSNRSEKIKFKIGEEIFETDHPKDASFKKYLLEKDMEIQMESVSLGEVLVDVTLGVGRLIFLIGFFLLLSNSMGLQMFKKKELLVVDVPNIKFDNIAGNKESKEEMRFLVDFLRNPKEYNKMGAKLPKGIVFYGPPGTGKTLTAKAMAGEAGVPFFSTSGSDFVEMYVGLGAKRVRELFEDAKKKAPCIVFIDEIDAVGTRRGGADGNSEKDQTINALLSELDGFNTNEPIVVIIATNRVEDLDPALVRPGRFDRHIAINLPDSKDRLEILNLYVKDKKISQEVDLGELSRLTIGFSGAGLQSLINEATIIAVNKRHKEVKKEDIDDAYFKIVMKGHKKKRDSEDNTDLELIAYHEAGHALCAKLITKNSIPKVTIIPSTSGAGGATFNIPNKMGLITKKEILNNVKVLYSGRVAEMLLKNDKDEITTGASQDIKQATQYLREYFYKFGMSEKYGMLNIENMELGSEVICEMRDLSKKLYEETFDLLSSNKEKLESIAKELMEKETLNEDDLNRIIFNEGD